LSEPWVPFDVEPTEAAIAELRGPHAGVPAWLHEPLTRWTRTWVEGWLDRLQMDLRLDPPLRFAEHRWGVSPRIDDLIGRCHDDDRFWFQVADWTIFNVGGGPPLEELLDASGSIYGVRDRRLYRRTDDTTQAAAQAIVDSGSPAGIHLARAWSAVYGVDPAPDVGYAESIRAVEAAAKGVVSPNNAASTMGTVIADIRNAPQKFRARLTPSPPKGPAVDAVATVNDMMRLLWQSEHSRHGDVVAPTETTLHEAEDAVRLAIVLVHLFQSGGFGLAP
jgi:hypothetical protein